MASAVRAFVIISLHFVIAVYTFQEYNLYENDNRVLIRRKRELVIQDFIDNIEEQLKLTAKRHKTSLLWVDFDGDFLQRSNNAITKDIYKNKKIKIFSGPTFYNQAPSKTASTQKGKFQAITRCNQDKDKISSFPLSVPIKKAYKFSWELKTKFTIKKKSGGTTKEVPIDLNLKPPEFANADAAMQKGVNMKSNFDGQFTQETVDQQLLEMNVTLDPRSVLKMDVFVESQSLELPFSSELIMEGFVVARYAKKVNGSMLAFYPIYNFADTTFQRRENAIVFNCTGVFRGGRGLETYVYTYDEELKDRECPKELNVRK